MVGGSRVAVIGSEVRDEFYPGQNPIGRKLDVNGQPFVIIGLLEAKGGSLGGSQDNVVDIPITTAQQVLKHEGHLRHAGATSPTPIRSRP